MEERKIKIGDIVTVTVDRPLGSYHPEHKKMYYPVNYGYIKGVIAPDGEEQDAYILGVDEPVEEFTGEVIGIVHREDDVETKLVVTQPDRHYTADEVMHRIKFTEKYYKSHLVMKLYGFDIDPEKIFELGFKTREDRNGYYLCKDETPTAEQLKGLFNLLSEKEELFFWNYYHRRISDPGSYVNASVVNGRAIMMEANHGWSSNYHNISLDDLAELIIRNWDKDCDLKNHFVNAIKLEKTFYPEEIIEEMEKAVGTFVPDYSLTPW